MDAARLVEDRLGLAKPLRQFGEDIHGNQQRVLGRIEGKGLADRVRRCGLPRAPQRRVRLP
jgi:hypothetical protein